MSARATGRRAASVAVAALLLWPAAGAAQDAGAAVREALALGRAGRLPAAAERLERARAGCAAAADGPACEKLVDYSLGYLFQVEAERATGDRSELLARAARYYEAVVGADPGYQDAVYNLSLVLRAMGPHEWQERYYRAAPEQDPRRRSQHVVFLADYYAARGSWAEAVRTYEAALAEDPASRPAAEGLLEVARQAPDGWTRGLMEHAEEWERTLPDLAARAYRTVLEASPRGEERVAERAFLRYAVLAARQGWVDAKSFAFPSSMAGPAEELVALLGENWQPPPPDSWWLRSDDRRRALAEISLHEGSRWVAVGRPDRAEQCWSAADSYVPPEWSEALDLKRELALLYFRHEELDPAGQRFRDLEHEIFLEKAGALRAADHAAAQRYHTALGLIYAERGEWSGPPARNAVDQLTWALDESGRVDAETGGHRPLPELRTLLATGLEERGDATRARELHFQAALGYLDTDDLDEAATALRRAGTTREAAPLREVLAVRRAMVDRAADRTADRTATAEAPCDRRALDRTTEAARAAGGDPFSARQRFKLLGDCARLLPPGRAARYEAEAFDLVVEQRVPLVGTGDLLRFQRARATVTDAAALPAPSDLVEYQAGDRRPAGIPIALAGDPRPAFLPVQEEQVVAARVVRLLAPDSGVLRVQLESGVLRIDSTQAETLSPALMDELTRVRGVKAVRVAPVKRRGGS